MGIIPISLDDDTIKKIDLLVKKGIYKNRSEALRDQIDKGLNSFNSFRSHIGNNDNLEAYSEVLEKLLRLKQPPFILKTEKSVTELVSEGRER